MNEQISALLDDEIAIEDAAHIISSVQSQKAAALAWQQYHLIGDAMRGDALLSANFKQNLMQKLDDEPTVLAPNMQNAKLGSAKAGDKMTEAAKNGLSARWSIAASFAAVMVVSYMALQNMGDTQDGVALIASHAPTTTVAIAQTNKMEVASATEMDSAPLDYLMAHQASSPSASSYYMQNANYLD